MIGCLHPIQIVRDGVPRIVPCGKCHACLNRRRLALTNAVNLESQEHSYCMFVTLTYDNECVPVVYVGISPLDDGFSVVVVDEDGVLLDIFPISVSCRRKYLDWLSLSRRLDKLNRPLLRFAPYGDIVFYPVAVLRSKDFQDFNKRLRYHLNKNFNEKVRFLSCGEYGPRSFRPHYHSVYFFDSPISQEQFSACVSAAWKYGRRDVQVSARKGCETYVAGYVTGSLRCPALLKRHEFRPFVTHSSHLGYLAYKKYIEDNIQEEDNAGRAVERVLSVNEKSFTASTPLSFQYSIFPKCYRYGDSVPLFNLLRYRLLDFVYSDFARREGIEVCRIKEFGYTLKDVASRYFYDTPDWHRKFVAGYSLNDLFQGARFEDFLKWFVPQLSLSSRFLRNCDRFHLSPQRYIRLIDDFWSRRDYRNLRIQCFHQLQDSLRGCSPADFIHSYGNILSNVPFDSLGDSDRVAFLSFYDNMVEQGYSMELLQLYEKYCNFESSFGYVDEWFSQCLVSEDFVKHRELNDLNKIFE